MAQQQLQTCHEREARDEDRQLHRGERRGTERDDRRAHDVERKVPDVRSEVSVGGRDVDHADRDARDQRCERAGSLRTQRPKRDAVEQHAEQTAGKRAAGDGEQQWRALEHEH